MNNVDYSRFAMFATFENVSDLLASQRGELAFRYCNFTHEVVKHDGLPLQDSDVLDATYKLSQTVTWAKSPPAKTTVYDAIQHAARRNPYHPVRDYLNSVVWDKIPRAHLLFSHYLGGADSPLRRAQGRAFLIGATARIMQAPHKVDVMPVLLGPQGWGKSTAVRTLAVRDRWFADTGLDLRNKDSMAQLDGIWLYEIGEMRSIMAMAPEVVKNYLTSQVDRYRPAYGKCKVYRPRQSVFIGTSNDLQLADTTGARRYWPILLLKKPKLDAIRDDRDQLWAEAKTLWAMNENSYITDESVQREAEKEQLDYMAPDPWIEQIERFWAHGWEEHIPATQTEFSRTIVRHPPRTPFEVGMLLSFIGVPAARQRQGDVMRLTRLLKSAGHTKKRQRVDGKKLTKWFVHAGHAGQADSKDF